MADDAADEDWQYRWGAKVLLPVDIPDDMCKDAVQQTVKCIEEVIADGGTMEENGLSICEKVKKFFDEKYSASWHMVLGKNFGCHATHEEKRFIYFYVESTTVEGMGGNYAVMIYKAG
jgi:dynein light chain LC8-type